MIKPLKAILGLILVSSSLAAQVNQSLKLESYKLPNGFTVFLNQDTTATRVFGAVMVNAGAKHEDPNATGMAHYLEHLLFKGTEEYGTTNYEAEKVHLDSINQLYEELTKTSDDDQRKAIQKAINDQAVKASKYGLPNEFDKMLKSIGGTGINAFTSNEMTFYHNSFPGHEIVKWLTLYADRFKNPVFRSFQSELEVVYEEKNRAMDNFERRVFREMEMQLFPNQPYGQWPVLGTIPHLKSPSLIRMYQFYEDNYVSNNMALILSGNFDPEVVKPVIAEQFMKIPKGDAKKVNIPPLEKFDSEKIVKKRMTPVKAGFIGFQTCDYNHEDRTVLDVAEYLLANNSETGLINQLMTNNEMIYSGAFSLVYNDAGGLVIFFVPKIVGQSLKKAEGKVEAQLEKVRTGNFSDEVFLAAKNDLISEFKRRLENVTSRGIMIGDAFNRGQDWESFIKYPELVDQVSKEDVMKIAQKYFGDSRVKVISRTGFPKKAKLDKPGYKPIVAEQKEESDYYKEFAKLQSLDFKPRYLDFEKDVEQMELKGGHELITSKNPVNDLFGLNIKFKIGRKDDARLIETAQIANYFGAGNTDVTKLKEQFAALGSEYRFSSEYNHFTLNISGRQDKLSEVLDLVNELLTNPRVDEKTKEIFINSRITDRKLERKTPRQMGRALYFYGIAGEKSEYLQRLNEKELKNLSVDEIVNKYKNITSNYSTEIHFAGGIGADEFSKLLKSKLSLSEDGQSNEYDYLTPIAPQKNKILFVNDKKTIQSIVYFHVQGEPQKEENFAARSAFQQYFGGGFSGLVLQEIREYRSLAYSAGGGYYTPAYPGGIGRLWGFIGCQADKTVDAIPVMVDLITNLPEKPERIAALSTNMQLKTITDFPEFRQLPESVDLLQKRGYTTDPNTEAFDQYGDLEMQDIVDFYESNIKGRPYLITIYGDKKRIDLDELKKYGEVVELDLEDIIKM